MQLFIVYIIDTNIVIDITRRIYPPRLRDEARNIVERLIGEGSILSHKEVLLELKAGAKTGDVPLAWANAHSSIFIDVTDEQESHLANVLRDHSDLVDPKKTGPDADPWLVALALERGAVVVNW
jgi:predicted nucleic acid-binding protein